MYGRSMLRPYEILARYSGGAAPDSHRLPFTTFANLKLVVV
jgi:hypothetical protein